MDVTQTSAEGLKREYKVVVAARDIDDKVVARLEEMSRTIRLPGFRPGKVPMAVVKTRFGKAVRGEVLEDALKEGTHQAIEQNELRPVVEPKVEVTKFADGSDLEYTMSLEVMPEIEPADSSKLSLERLVCEVREADVDEALARMAEQIRSFKPAAPGYEAKSGDTLVIDFVGKLDGVPFEGGSGQDHQLVLGSSSFVDTFEDQLIGSKAGDRVEVNVTFPEEYVNDKLAGRPALFEIEVKEVKESLPVAVDEALARNLGMDNLDALRKALRERIERERNSLSRARLKRSLLDKLAEQYDFEVPPSLLEAEYELIRKRAQDELKRSETSLEDWGRSEEEAKEEFLRIAQRRVRLGLLLAEIGRRNNIDVPEDELNRAMVEEARRFPGEERKVLEHLRQHPEAAYQLRAPLFEDKVVDFIFEMAQVSERQVSLDELLRDPDEQDGAAPKASKATTTKTPKGSAAIRGGESAEAEGKGS